MKARKFPIAGRIWRWIYRPLRNDYGVCNYTERTITIDSGRAHAGIDLLDTEIHEALHALQAFATEEHTAEVASTLAVILWGLGYRLTIEHAGRGYLGE